MVQELQKNNVTIEIIAIQETWHINYIETVTLPGFNFIFKQREKGRGGGVGFYISETLNYKIIDDLSPFVEKTIECLTVEIFTKKSKKTLLSNIYHSPTPAVGLTVKSHTENFLQLLDELLSNISLFNINTVAFTDSNINLLNLDRNPVAVDYLNLLHSNSFIQSIQRATRIAEKNFSLIDHILIKNAVEKKFVTGVLINDLSDHFLTFYAPNQSKIAIKKPNHVGRNFSDANLTHFRNDLQKENWNNVLQTKDVNISFNNFSEKL